MFGYICLSILLTLVGYCIYIVGASVYYSVKEE